MIVSQCEGIRNVLDFSSSAGSGFRGLFSVSVDEVSVVVVVVVESYLRSVML